MGAVRDNIKQVGQSSRQSKMKFLLISLIALVFSATATPISGPTSGCSAVHVITARASTEAPGEGIIGTVVTAIVGGSSQTVSREAVAYPATLTNYLVSENQGVTAMKADLAAQVSKCPDTKIVLMGYSQGAQVAGDVLASRATGTDKVVATILMGDPGHVAGEPFQKGTANAVSGLFPRAPGALNAFASVIESFCDIGDPFCAGGLNLAVHLGYV
ncbi:Acetylxylan esterase 2, partial [Termitomyces sp. T112]